MPLVVGMASSASSLLVERHCEHRLCFGHIKLGSTCASFVHGLRPHRDRDAATDRASFACPREVRLPAT